MTCTEQLQNQTQHKENKNIKHNTTSNITGKHKQNIKHKTDNKRHTRTHKTTKQ